MDEDVYFLKELAYRYHGHEMRFRVSQDLFSSYQIDIGTQFLLRTLISETGVDKYRKVLDLGCGYGPIGITLKKLNNECAVHMVDRDALALAYSRQNAELNGVPGIEIYGSLGYDDVTATDFDLIISNIPGKAGEPVVSGFLQDAARYLTKDGMVAVVVITPLEPVVSGVLEKMPDVEVLFHKSRSGHAVFHYRFTSDGGIREQYTGGFEKGIYRQDSLTVSCRGLNYRMNAAFDLPENEFPGFRSEMLIEAVSDIISPAVNTALLFNPGQGHVPVAVWQILKPDNICLSDRDLLSLRVTENNLILNGCPADRVRYFHRTGTGMDNQQLVDLVIGTIREEEGVAAINDSISGIADILTPGGTAILSASSTAITRIVDRLQERKKFIVKKREKRKGNSLLILERK